MTYQLRNRPDGTQDIVLLDNSVPLVRGIAIPPNDPAYLAWLDEGNTPEPAPVQEDPPVLTTEQKLEAAGLTVAELKELFGLE